MSPRALDWAVIGLVLFIAGGILGAFFLYLRTSYRKGGWKQVRIDFILAIAVLLLWGLTRIDFNHAVQELKRAADQGFR